MGEQKNILQLKKKYDRNGKSMKRLREMVFHSVSEGDWLGMGALQEQVAKPDDEEMPKLLTKRPSDFNRDTKKYIVLKSKSKTGGFGKRFYVLRHDYENNPNRYSQYRVLA